MKLRAQEGMIWRRWGDEYVVYNPLSGDTHLLDLVSAQGLLQLEKHNLSDDELAQELSAALDIDADEDLIRYVRRIVTELSELGLLKSVQS